MFDRTITIKLSPELSAQLDQIIAKLGTMTPADVAAVVAHVKAQAAKLESIAANVPPVS